MKCWLLGKAAPMAARYELIGTRGQGNQPGLQFSVLKGIECR